MIKNKKTNNRKKIMICLSGGQDSATVLAWAIKNFDVVETVSFSYNQRHDVELEHAKKLSNIANVNHTILHVNTLKEIGNSALLNKVEKIKKGTNNLPTSFVPGRNLIFSLYASALAYKKGFKHIGLGVCEMDYSGYPDCRDETIKSMEETIKKGFNYDIHIHTPLMWLTKSKIIKLMKKLNKIKWYKYTHTCYNPNKEGISCGECPACKIRIKGFKEAGYIDPIKYQIKIDWGDCKRI